MKDTALKQSAWCSCHVLGGMRSAMITPSVQKRSVFRARERPMLMRVRDEERGGERGGVDVCAA